MAAPFGERRNSVEATGSDLPSRPANHAFDWTTSHPVQCFPKEHALAEVRHQCHVLRGLLPSEPVAQGVAVAATISGATSSPCAATGAVAVGVALDRPPPAAHYSFLGSGMTADAHAPQHSSVDLEGEGGAGEMARLHFEYYGRCYHHEPRYKYEHEHTFPSGEAIGAARTEFDTLLARAKGQSLACRAYNAVERPVPQKQPNELPRPHLQRTIRLSGSRGDDARIYSCSWAGDRHVVCSIRTGYLLVCDVTNGMRTMVASPKGRGHVCLLGAAAHGAHSHAPPTLLACGGLTNAIHLWNLQASGYALDPLPRDRPTPAGGPNTRGRGGDLLRASCLCCAPPPSAAHQPQRSSVPSVLLTSPSPRASPLYYSPAPALELPLSTAHQPRHSSFPSLLLTSPSARASPLYYSPVPALSIALSTTHQSQRFRLPTRGQ